MRSIPVVLAAVLAFGLAGCADAAPAEHPQTVRSSGTAPAPRTSAAPAPRAVTSAALPRPAHVVVVVLENHSFDQVALGANAPYIRALVRTGAVLTHFYAITHPSEPNYLALFSGSTQGVTGDPCPLTFRTSNLGRSLLNAHRTFAGYSEGLPRTGYTGCASGEYVRRHAPWTNFTDLPGSVSRPMTAFPRDFTRLPTVSFVIPNLVHDMHDGTLQQADVWLRQNLGPYVYWARTHNSLFVLTADEDDGHSGNRIATVVVGAHARPGHYAQRLTHYSLLRTIEDMYGLPRLGHSATAVRIDGIWS